MKQLILRFVVLPVVASRINEETKWSVPKTTGNLSGVRLIFQKDRMLAHATRQVRTDLQIAINKGIKIDRFIINISEDDADNRQAILYRRTSVMSMREIC